MPRHALPRAFELARWSYCLDFVLAPSAVAGLIWLAWQLDLGGWGGVGLYLAGVAFWTFAEYWIHRSLFHGPFAAMHDEHHRQPKAFIGVGSSGTFAAFGVTWLLLAALLGEARACAVLAGLISGYLVYCVVHGGLHHFAGRGFGRYGAMMLRLHNAHHRGGSRSGHANFGVTSPLWDVVFRTWRP